MFVLPWVSVGLRLGCEGLSVVPFISRRYITWSASLTGQCHSLPHAQSV